MGKWRLFTTDYKLPKSPAPKQKYISVSHTDDQQNHYANSTPNNSSKPRKQNPRSPVTLAQETFGRFFHGDKNDQPKGSSVVVKVQQVKEPPAEYHNRYTTPPVFHPNAPSYPPAPAPPINRSISDYNTDNPLHIESDDISTHTLPLTLNHPELSSPISPPQKPVFPRPNLPPNQERRNSGSDSSGGGSLKRYERGPITQFLDEESTPEDSSFQRGGNYRSLPMGRAAWSYTNTRKPLGMVFLICRGETKKSTLPFAIRHIDAVRALFVKTFPAKLSSIQDLRQPWRKIYNFDHATQLFYELEDLADVKDGSVLKLYEEEPTVDDASYFSEPELEAVPHHNTPLLPRRNMGLPDDNRYRPSSVPPPETIRSYTPHQQRRQMTKTPEPFLTSPRDLASPGLRSGSVTPQNFDLFSGSRMQKMENQLANLTAWVHSEISSRPSSAMSNKTDVLLSPTTTQKPLSFTDLGPSRRQSDSDDYTALHKPLKDMRQKIQGLRMECNNLKRIQQANAQSIGDTIKLTTNKIVSVMKTVPGVSNVATRAQRSQIDQQLDTYLKSSKGIAQDLNDLETSVEELRADVINKRCRVSAQHVDGMAVHLSKVSRSLASLKTEFPQLRDKLGVVMCEEVRIVSEEKGMLQEEPAKLEDVLKRCKKLTGTLYTLKRLALVQEHRPPMPIPFNVGEVSRAQQDSVLVDIASNEPDHEARITKISEANNARERNQRLSQPSDMTFENALDIANKALQESTQLAIVKPKVRESSPDYENEPPRQEIAVEHQNGMVAPKKTPPMVPLRTSSAGMSAPDTEEEQQKKAQLQKQYEELRRMQQQHDQKQTLDVITEVDE